MSRSRPIRSSISAHSAPVRWSFQRIAGRTTLSWSSRATRPCIWPERPIPAMSPPSSARAASLARHQSSGSCSDQPGRGVESRYERSAVATTSPSGVIAIALTPVVPTSRPAMSVTRLGAEGGVDQLVGADGVLALLRLAEGSVVDPARDLPDEVPLLDGPPDSRHGILRVRIEVEPEPLAVCPVVRAPQLERELEGLHERG